MLIGKSYLVLACQLPDGQWIEKQEIMSYSDRVSERIEQLENEIKEKQEIIDYSSNQTTIDNLKKTYIIQNKV